jgi:hypothetical protein
MGQSSWAIIEVMRERARQDKIWGVQNHEMARWHLILAEEFGEVSKACNEFVFRAKEGSFEEMRTELVQTAAVCIAMIEAMDRQRGA